MKKILGLLITAVSLCSSALSFAQESDDKSKRASPPMEVRQTITGGATITISYGQPSVKGRTIGKDLEPMEGEIWRAGANESTVFETDKALTIEGRPLPAGKYAFFTKKTGKNWTLIFNRTWKGWGTYGYEKNKKDDALQVKVPERKAPSFSEKLTYTISPEGLVSLNWGDLLIRFKAATAPMGSR